jgi:hypothetical protein
MEDSCKSMVMAHRLICPGASNIHGLSLYGNIERRSRRREIVNYYDQMDLSDFNNSNTGNNDNTPVQATRY